MTYDINDRKNSDFKCKKCPWNGKGGELQHGEMFRECSELLCPKCGEIVSMLSFQTTCGRIANSGLSATEQEKAAKNLQAVDLAWKVTRLHSPNQLPDIDADYIVLLWDQDWNNHAIRILFGDREIFQQGLEYEYTDYFLKACRILKEKYGYRLIDVVPTPRAETYLWGDRLGSPDRTDEMRRLLGRDNQSEYGTVTPEALSRIQEWKTYRKEYDPK